MSYKLQFHPNALAEWQKLDGAVRAQLKTRLAQRLEQPHVPASRISGGTNLYKIKLRTLGYRLVYQVRDQQLLVLVLAVGKRDRLAAYRAALGRQAEGRGK